jgi:hypothetical protein
MGNYHALLAKSPAFFAEQAGYEGHRPPPQFVLDRIAEESITGKYDTSASNLCGLCFQARSVNGTCACDD